MGLPRSRGETNRPGGSHLGTRSFHSKSKSGGTGLTGQNWFQMSKGQITSAQISQRVSLLLAEAPY